MNIVFFFLKKTSHHSAWHAPRNTGVNSGVPQAASRVTRADSVTENNGELFCSVGNREQRTGIISKIALCLSLKETGQYHTALNLLYRHRGTHTYTHFSHIDTNARNKALNTHREPVSMHIHPYTKYQCSSIGTNTHIHMADCIKGQQHEEIMQRTWEAALVCV